MDNLMTVPPPLTLPPNAVMGALEAGGPATPSSVDVFLDGDTSSEEDPEMPGLYESQSSAAESSDSESSEEEPWGRQDVSNGITPTMFFNVMKRTMEIDPEFREHMRREGVNDPMLCPELGLSVDELRERLDLPETPRQTPPQATPKPAAQSAPKRKKQKSPVPAPAKKAKQTDAGPARVRTQ